MTPNHEHDFEERKSRLADLQREALMQQRIRDLGLTIAGTRLEPLVHRLYQELADAGIRLKPPVYLTDEWGCPEGVPIIGIPFYLADEHLTRLEDEINEGVEVETDQDILRYLRHEAGHAFNYAYKAHDRADWRATFGAYDLPYEEDYRPEPFSRHFVRHISGWYAQKHPDEDFAESFAVWLDPQSHWETAYAGWPALDKLNYIGRLVGELGAQPPLVEADDFDQYVEADYSLADHYSQFGYRPTELPDVFDSDLLEIFAHGARPDNGTTVPAADLIAAGRRSLVRRISHWTGLNEWKVRSLLDHFARRSEALDLWAPSQEADQRLRDLAICATTLSMNWLVFGSFVKGGSDRSASPD